MFELTLEGLDDSIRFLIKGKERLCHAEKITGTN
jgi:hypothetical protein